jgi:hypothetical protein
MSDEGLQIADNLAFPLDAVTQTFALLAVRRAGKSNAAAVMAEEMFKADLPFVAIDPKGDWWGLRSSADGKGDGLPIPIFGGLRGDMPLIPESGKLIAELIVEQNLTCILDVSRFSKAARVRFLTPFADRLYELHQADPQARHLFMEEADRVVPQKVTQDMAACVGAFSDIVRLGGSFGLGATLISQRSAVINKDVLTQVETMIALRTTSPQDRKVIRDWMEHHALAAEIVDSLPGLLSGEAWVSSSFFLAEHGQPAIQRIRFRRRATFDSGATPKVGQQRKVASLADIDLGALGERMAAVTEKAEQDDPKALRRRIAELERGRKTAPAPVSGGGRAEAENRDLRAQLDAALAREPERVEVPVLSPGDLAGVEQVITAIRDLAGGLQAEAARLESALSSASASAPPAPAARPAGRVQSAPRPVPAPASASPSGSGEDAAPLTLGKSHRAVLSVLAQFPEGRSKKQLAMLAGYSPTSGGFNGTLAALRAAEFIERGDPIAITDAGRSALGDDWEPLPTGSRLIDYWLTRLSKAEGTVLQLLIDSWPAPMSKESIAAAAGYSVSSGGFNGALARLRTLQLITGGAAGMRADETLAQTAAVL